MYSTPALWSEALYPPWGGKGARSLNTTPRPAPSMPVETMVALQAL